MSYEIGKLQQLIDALEPKRQTSHTNPTSTANELYDEVKRVKSALVHIAFSAKNEAHIERLIQLHQRELIRLMDQLLEKDALPRNSNVYYKALLELLEFIENHFTKYFDIQAPVPRSYIDVAQQEFEESYKEIRKALLAKRISTKLLKELDRPFKRLASANVKSSISFQSLIFDKELLKVLRYRSKSGDEAERLNEKIIHSLIYLNYNSYRFFNYYSDVMKKSVQQLTTLTEQLDKWAWYHKTINHIQKKPGTCYKCDNRPIKALLLDYVLEEYEYLEKKRQLTFSYTEGASPISTPDFKIATKLTVPKLAFLLKVMVESGIIVNKNHTKIIKHFAKNFCTQNTQDISAESLRTKYYNVEDQTKKEVKDMIIQMLNYTRSN